MLEYRLGAFSGIHVERLVVGFCLTAVLALSVHVVMLQVMNVPYPLVSFPMLLPQVINNGLMAWGALRLYGCLRAELRLALQYSPSTC